MYIYHVCRYQAVLGGNSIKSIGAVLIDSGVMKKVVPQECFRPKDFASDKLILDLNNVETVQKILSLEGYQDSRSLVVTCLNLFFMRTHLFAVNSKSCLLPKERVFMLWHSFLWFLHIDGVSIITKKNFLSECVSLSFLILRDDVSEPHLLTSEPSEHANALLRGLKREFTVKDLIYMIAGLVRFWIAVIKGGLKLARKAAGYASTLGATVESTREASIKIAGPVQVVHDNLDIVPPVSKQLWVVLRPILNSSSKNMQTFMKNICFVKEEHPMMKEFSDTEGLEDLTDRCRKFYNAKSDDELFKKETLGGSAGTYNGNEILSNNTDIQQEKNTSNSNNISRIINVERDIIIQELNLNQQSRTPFSNTEKDLIFNGKESQDAMKMIFESATLGVEDTPSTAVSNIYSSFVDVVKQQEYKTFIDRSENNKIIKSMCLMTMKDRERGTDNNVGRFNTLLGRWFGEKKEAIATADESESGNCIERGSIIKLKNDSNFYLVFAVMKKTSNNKWWNSEINDKLSWPIEEKIIKSKSYRLKLRKLVAELDSENDTYTADYIDYDQVEDGTNVRKTYFLEKNLGNISELRSTFNI